MEKLVLVRGKGVYQTGGVSSSKGYTDHFAPAPIQVRTALAVHVTSEDFLFNVGGFGAVGSRWKGLLVRVRAHVRRNEWGGAGAHPMYEYGMVDNMFVHVLVRGST